MALFFQIQFESLATQVQGGSPRGISEPPGHVSMTTAQPMPITPPICPSPRLPPLGSAFPVCFPGRGVIRDRTGLRILVSSLHHRWDHPSAVG